MQPYLTMRDSTEVQGLKVLMMIRPGRDELVIHTHQSERRATKRIWNELIQSNFAWCCTYANGGGEKDLEAFLMRLSSGKIKVIAKVEDRGSYFDFWGDVKGFSHQGFRFMIFDEMLAYQVMMAISVDSRTIQRSYMHPKRRKFDIHPEIRDNRLRYVRMKSSDDKIVPPIFELQDDGTYYSKLTRSRLIFGSEHVEVWQQVLPQGAAV